MRINNNIPSMHTQGALFMNNRQIGQDLERLSTGLRINRASDDAAGLAVSEGLRTQVRGQEQARRNTLDGVSALNIAEGAMNEIHNILQRMREIGVQASTATYTATERQFLDDEFQTLSNEITRIVDATNFNGLQLLSNDSIFTTANIGAAENAAVAEARDGLTGVGGAGTTAINAIRDVLVGSTGAFATAGAGQGLTGAELRGAATAAANDIFDNVMNRVFAEAGNLRDLATTWGTGTDAPVMAPTDALEGALNTQITAAIAEVLTATGGAAQISGTQTDVLRDAIQEALLEALHDVNIMAYNAQQNRGAALHVDANSTIDTDGVNSGAHNQILAQWEAVAAPLGATLTGDDGRNADDAIRAVDLTIQQISSSRADIGTLVNRLESTINNLTVSATNQQAAESQIRDVDFAFQSSRFTRNQIMVQSSTAMLAQANAQSQNVLSLLR